MERAIQISGDAFGNLAGWMEQSFKVKNIAPMVVFLAAYLCLMTYLAVLVTDFMFNKRLSRERKVFPVGIACGIGLSFLIDGVMGRLPAYVPRLKDILSNASFILGASGNSEKFLGSLGLSLEQADRIPEIVYKMNTGEWEQAINGAGNMAWYLRRIQYSLDRTVSMFGTNAHLGRQVSMQGIGALLPVLLLLAFAIGLFIMRHRASALATAVMAGISYRLYLGSSFFLVCYLISLFLFFLVGKAWRWKKKTQVVQSPREERAF